MFDDKKVAHFWGNKLQLHCQSNKCSVYALINPLNFLSCIQRRVGIFMRYQHEKLEVNLT